FPPTTNSNLLAVLRSRLGEAPPSLFFRAIAIETAESCVPGADSGVRPRQRLAPLRRWGPQKPDFECTAFVGDFPPHQRWSHELLPRALGSYLDRTSTRLISAIAARTTTMAQAFRAARRYKGCRVAPQLKRIQLDSHSTFREYEVHLAQFLAAPHA